MSTLYATVVVGLVVYALHRVLRIGHRPSNLPPGPPTVPVLGNIHLIPKDDPHIQFQKWAQEYGPIYSLMLGTKTMIVLNSAEVVKELLDKKSAITSARPDLYFGQTLMSGGKRMVMMTYGAPWRTIRKLYHNALHVNKSIDYIPYQETENKQLMWELATDTETDPLVHFRRYSSSLVTSIVYGFRWPTFNAPLHQKLFHNLDNYVRLNSTGGAALADFYPILRLLPAWLSPAKREALAHYNSEIEMYTQLYRDVKASIQRQEQSGKASRACVMKDIIALQAAENFADDYACHMPAQLFEAGADTTSTQLYGFLAALLLYPSVQETGQAELDKVIGDARMPTLDDMPNLPYVRACVKETLRWHPSAILGAFPHAMDEDTYCLGHRIPKDATLMTNTWTLNRDARRYPDPAAFVPERYLGDDTSSAASAKMDAKQRDHFGFGAGRRICPGMHVADRSLLLAVSRLFWAFNVGKREGGRMPVQDEFVPGFVAVPRRFDVSITPRSEEKRRIVEREWEEARRELDREGQFL